MTVGWVKVHDGFPDHPKVIAAGPDAAWLFVCGLAYCSRFLTDGHIPTAQVSRLTTQRNASRLAGRLVDAGLWETNGSGYVVHGYLDWQASSAQIEVDRVKARERARKSAEVRGNFGRRNGAASSKFGRTSGKVREPDVDVDKTPPTPPDASDAGSGQPDGLATPRGRRPAVTTDEKCPTCNDTHLVPDLAEEGRVRQCPTCTPKRRGARQEAAR